jgi:hypothetical protein
MFSPLLILSGTPLREWWKQDTNSTVVALLDLMSQALEICEEWKEPNLYKEGKAALLFSSLLLLFFLLSHVTF